MKLLRKLFKTGKYDLTKYEKTKIQHYEQFEQSFKDAGMSGITLLYPGPPSINEVFITKIEGEVYYAYWDKYGIYVLIRQKELIIQNYKIMEKSKLFQYAIIWNPTVDEAKDGKRAKVVVEITSVFAKDDKEVLILASRSIPEEYLTQLNQVDIIVRPF